MEQEPTYVGIDVAKARTREEAGEARVDVLEYDLSRVETGVCGATAAGEAETPTQSVSGCRVD